MHVSHIISQYVPRVYYRKDQTSKIEHQRSKIEAPLRALGTGSRRVVTPAEGANIFGLPLPRMPNEPVETQSSVATKEGGEFY